MMIRVVQAAPVAFLAAALLVAGFVVFPVRAAGNGTLEIVSASGVHAFTVELATNDAERERGLMYRKSMPQGHGMLFDFQHEQPLSFWMHNTYIPLDMIFIRGDGRIAHIVENATPMSDALIPSTVPVRAVLEVIAGTVRDLGIADGDKVINPIFGNAR
ncbi:MAG TPA: DUF192 domain-containing protein [Acetobacteraceae bacterium]|nr:DUF192 domain-containing protein [Acetobacteraceae bacterium]